MLNDFARQSWAALRVLIVFTVILGIVYPVSVWAVGYAFGDRAHGQPIEVAGTTVGSRLIGQSFSGDEWFHSRPSANDYDTLASAPSNLGPLSEDLQALIDERRDAVAATEGVAGGDVPPDALTASASGLDPHVSVAYAELQVSRVAAANGLDVGVVEDLVDEHTTGRFLGIFGEPAVNVLELNVAIDEAASAS